jgi:raffinose/stachyose/melibiose transport system substrate-binding protein
MKKSITLFVFLTLCTVCLFANGQKESEKNSSASSTTVIKFFHRWPNDPKFTYFKKLVASYEAGHPGIKIQMDYVLNDSYKEKIRAEVTSGDLPDVFCSWSDSFARNLVESGQIRQINDLIEKDKAWSSRVLPSQLKGFTFNGKLYAMPMMMDAKVFVYNKAAFEKYGLTPPKTYDELIHILDVLKKNGYKMPIFEGFSDPWTVSHYLGPIFYSLVPEEKSLKDYDPKTGTFTDPGYKKGFEYFKQLAGYMGDQCVSIGHEEARSMFSSGEVPVMFLETAEFKLLDNANAPDYGTFGFPVMPDGKGRSGILMGAPEGWMLSKNASREAIEFFKFLVNDESMKAFTRDTGEISPYKGTVDSSNASVHTIAAAKLIEQTSYMIPWFDNAVDLSVGDAFMRGGQAIISGDKTIDQVVAEVQKTADGLRNKYVNK